MCFASPGNPLALIPLSFQNSAALGCGEFIEYVCEFSPLLLIVTDVL